MFINHFISIQFNSFSVPLAVAYSPNNQPLFTLLNELQSQAFTFNWCHIENWFFVCLAFVCLFICLSWIKHAFSVATLSVYDGVFLWILFWNFFKISWQICRCFILNCSSWGRSLCCIFVLLIHRPHYPLSKFLSHFRNFIGKWISLFCIVSAFDDVKCGINFHQLRLSFKYIRSKSVFDDDFVCFQFRFLCLKYTAEIQPLSQVAL